MVKYMAKKNLADYEKMEIPPADAVDGEVIETTETELTNLKDVPLFRERKDAKTK